MCARWCWWRRPPSPAAEGAPRRSCARGRRRRSGFLFGAIGDDATWRAFAAAAELRDLPEVDFAREMVVFVVLDARAGVRSIAFRTLDGAALGSITP